MHPNSQPRFFLPKTMNRASAKDRFVAHIIDLIAISVVASFIIGAVGALGTYVSAVVYFSYFILAHKLFGKTVGKQAMGIFLASNESEGLTWKQVILREVVWKVISAIPLFYGYFRIYIYKEALHDMYSNTTVVSEKKVEASFMKAVLATFVMAIIFGSSVYYCLTQTSFVGHLLVKRLAEKGHIIKGLAGNPKKGWSVDYWRGQNSQGTYEFHGVRFLYDFSSLYSDGVVRIKEVRASRVVYWVNELPPFLQKEKKDAVSSVQPAPNVADAKRQVESDERSDSGFISKLIIEKINFGNIKIIRRGEEDVDVNRFYITQLAFDRKEVSLKQAYIDAPNIQFQLWDSKVDFASQTVDLKTEFQLRKGLHRSILKTISGKMEFQGDIRNPRSIKGEAFDGRLRVNYTGSRFALQIRSLTPSHYISYDTNITRLTASMSNTFCSGYACMNGGNAYGAFYHNKKKFIFKGNDVWAEDKKGEPMKLQLTSLWMNAIGRSPIFSVSTDAELHDFVSEIYFSKSYYTLTPDERANIDGVRRDFFKYANRSLSTDKNALPSREDFNK